MAVDDPRDPDEIEDEIEGQDAGLDDNEGGNEAEAGQESPDAQAEEGQVDERPSRATRAVQEAKRATREAQEARAALEREVQQLRAERAQRENTPKGESFEDEQARLSLMTSDERTDYKIAKAKRENDLAINVMRFQSADVSDKAVFESKAGEDPRRKKYAADVESLLTMERHSGRNHLRETLYYYILGQRVAAGGGKAAKEAAAARVKSQEARADSGRSDRAPARRNEGGNTLRDLERRLENVPL